MKGLKVFCVWVLAIAVTVVDGQSRIAYLKTREKKELDSKEWTSNLNVVSVPFQFSGTNILINVDLGHKNGLFILDTGAPALVINDPHPKKEVLANGVNGALSMEDTTIRFVKIEQVEWRNISAYALDLRQLETRNRLKILGLVGYELLKKHEVLIAPKEQILYLLPADESSFSGLPQPMVKIPVALEEHIPIIEVKINGKNWKFGIDTGAESNLISAECLTALSTAVYQKKGIDNVRGLDKKVKSCQIVELNNLEIGNLVFEKIDFTAIDFDHIAAQSGIQLDGLIGSALLSKMKFSINYRKRNFKIWEKY
ncbi:MAG: pepsin/retropepsin-like aspartic protease family protein [Haliscomenobacter sp.]|uniref:pepsin/retropepsin-like aspartic protease family protein n=1 Tax=Haliscomenobacter sp. TaxID=2717303 RepID=UPI0029A2B82C|nr:pepsin/retropepsin-like aspartic protease family protein [Haliscomenobacter sp.]MDX2070731.1 pepsin/retropepsin-like aspartic protease family protein [Haliscomenobacter sp.]